MGNDTKSWKFNEMIEVFSFDYFILTKIKGKIIPESDVKGC